MLELLKKLAAQTKVPLLVVGVAAVAVIGYLAWRNMQERTAGQTFVVDPRVPGVRLRIPPGGTPRLVAGDDSERPLPGYGIVVFTRDDYRKEGNALAGKLDGVAVDGDFPVVVVYNATAFDHGTAPIAVLRAADGKVLTGRDSPFGGRVLAVAEQAAGSGVRVWVDGGSAPQDVALERWLRDGIGLETPPGKGDDGGPSGPPAASAPSGGFKVRVVQLAKDGTVRPAAAQVSFSREGPGEAAAAPGATAVVTDDELTAPLPSGDYRISVRRVDADGKTPTGEPTVYRAKVPAAGWQRLELVVK